MAPTSALSFSTLCLFRQDLSEDLKLKLNTRIELALADQGWEALAAQLRMNDHLNVRFRLYWPHCFCVYQ